MFKTAEPVYFKVAAADPDLTIQRRTNINLYDFKYTIIIRYLFNI